MFYGNDGEISNADLEHIDEVTMKKFSLLRWNRVMWCCLTITNACMVVLCLMGQGSMVLLDSKGEEKMKADASSLRRKEAISEPYFVTSL